MQRGPGRRERKKLETRQRILDGAVALFAAQGYEATTIEEIAESADVARATVFNFYPHKSDLVLAWFTDRRAELASRLADSGRPETPTPTLLAGGFRTIAHLFDRDPRIGRAMVRAWLQAGGPLLTPESDTSSMFSDAIRAGQRRGDVAPDVDADRAGRVLFDAYLGVLCRWVSREDPDVGIETELLATLDVLLAGISNHGPVGA